MQPNELECLPYNDIREKFNINHNAYHGPYNFQIWREVEKGLFPYTDTQAISEPAHFIGTSGNGAPIKWHTRYKEENNPVERDITGFVAGHPYPHTINPEESPDEYWNGVKSYQDRVRDEMLFHLLKVLLGAFQKPELGVQIFPLAFNGAKPIGKLIEDMNIPQEQLFTVQVKRLPTIEKGLVIAAGGIQLPRAVHKGEQVFPIMTDDCLATWATQKLVEDMLKLAGAKIGGKFYSAVVATKFPMREELRQTDIPTYVSISAQCNKLADNGYLLTSGETQESRDIQQVGDMGFLLNTSRNGDPLPHSDWGINTLAHTLYQQEA